MVLRSFDGLGEIIGGVWVWVWGFVGVLWGFYQISVGFWEGVIIVKGRSVEA